MAHFWQTGVAKDVVLASTASKKKKKNRSAAKIRAGKAARAARRAEVAAASAAARVADGAATDGVAAAEGVAEGKSAQGLILPPSAPLVPHGVTKAGDNTDSAVVRMRGWICSECTCPNVVWIAQCKRCKMIRPKLAYKDAILITVDKSNQSTISAEQSTISAEQSTISADQSTISADQSTISADQSAIETESTIPTVQSTIESEQSAKTTGITPIVIGRRQSVMVPRVTPATDELYYPIYGEYYTGQDVTVTRKYATTVEEWQVAFINERRETVLGIEYRVLWVHPDRDCRQLYLRTWEPAARLREDGFADELDLVDRWKASDVPLFEDFWRQDRDGMGLLGADEDNLCVFNALKRAAELLGRPDLITEQDIEQFIDDRQVLYNQDLRAGATWIDVRDFMIRLRKAGRDINYNAFVKNNYMKPGRRGARVMKEEPLEDGVYVVAAYNHSHIGHAAVLSVKGRRRLIYDKKNEQGKPISSAKGWINFYAFIRPFIIF